MKAVELLENLERQGFELVRDGDGLKVAPRDKITPELRRRIEATL